MSKEFQLSFTAAEIDERLKKIDNKQDKLTFDSTPTENSTNPVTSGGVYTEVNYAKTIANMAMPGSLKWDGVVGDREQLIMSEEPVAEGVIMRQGFVHVSDYVPEILTLMMEGAPAEERILSALFSMSGEMSGEGAEEIQVQVADDMFIMGEAFLYVPTDGYSLEGFAFPKKGWYFVSASVIMDNIEAPVAYINGLQIEGVSFPDTNGGSDKYFESIETEEVYKLLRDASDEGVSTGGIPVYKVSSEVPPISVFSNGYKIINEDNGYSYEVTIGMTAEYIVKENNGLYILCVPETNPDGIKSPFPLIFVIPYNEYDFNGVTIPTAGMYTSATNEITLIGRNGSCEIIKTEHLPEALRFGEMAETVYSGTLEWDGNTDGLESITGDCSYYKVTDVVPTYNDLLQGFTVCIAEAQFPITPDNVGSNVTVNDDGGFMSIRLPNLPECIYVFFEGNAVGYSHGVYFVSSEGAYVESLTIDNYNGFENKVTIVKKIDSKYLPDGIGGGISSSEVDAKIETAIGAAIAASY